jgi:hypothetical protein
VGITRCNEPRQASARPILKKQRRCSARLREPVISVINSLARMTASWLTRRSPDLAANGS